MFSMMANRSASLWDRPSFHIWSVIFSETVEGQVPVQSLRLR